MVGEPDPFAEFLDDYFSECDEHLLAVRRGLLSLESALGPDGAPPDPELVEDLFRRFHTIKGLSSMVGVREAEELAHRMEAGLRSLRQAGAPALTVAVVELLADASRLLEQVIAAWRLGQPSPEVASTVERLAATFDSSQAAPGGADEQARLDAALAGGGLAWWFEFSPSPELAERGINVTTVRARLTEIGTLVRAVPRVRPEGSITFEFLVVSQVRPDAIRALVGEELDFRPYAAVGVAAPTAGPTANLTISPANVVRVDLVRLDELMQLAGRLITSHDRLDRVLQPLERLLPTPQWRAIEDADQAMERELGQLREHVLRLRLVSIGGLLERMRFLAYDLAREAHKVVSVYTSGQATQIDNFVVEQMMDPMLHLVRNALVHGIEPPAERQAEGKSPEGRLDLRASPVGDRVIIEVEDDGRGVDLEGVARWARQLGRVVSDDELGPDRLLEILAMPGFTTRERADLTSGHGIGLPAAYNKIQELGGTMAVNTAPGRGTCFRIELPLTLLIIDTLIVDAGGHNYAVPQSAVRELVEVPAGVTTALDGRGPHREVITHRDTVLPLIHLARLLGSRRADAGDNSTRYALIIGAGSEPVGLLVDRLLGQREIVVQPLIDPLLHVPGVAAATQLGNGQVVLVLDPAALMAGRQAASIRRRPASRGLALPGGVPRLAEQGGSTRPASIVSSTDVQGEEMSSASQLQAEPFILFRLADTTYAVRSEAVQHVDMVGQITPIPDAPPFLDGVALVRGQMIPAINLRVRFGFERIPYDLAARLVVVRTAGRTVGLIVDAAREFLAIAAGAIQPPPEPVTDLSGDWVEGIAALGGRMVVVLNIDEVIRLADAVPQGGSAEGAPVQED